MERSDAFKEMVNDTCELLRRAARGKKRTIRVSLEVAEMLNSLETVGVPDAAREEFAGELFSPSVDVKDIATLEELAKVVSTCRKCPLCKTRTQTVFGSGNPRAKLVFVGEAPGHDEDVQGKPFVGLAGQLLTGIIEKGMRLKRSEVYICNVIKCRPPENRDPLPSEKDMCEPYLIRQLEIIQPKVICALGTHAAQTLLKTTDPIGRLRGKWHFYHGIPLRATYHPAYLLRKPGEKKATWMDVLEVLKVYKGEYTPEPER